MKIKLSVPQIVAIIVGLIPVWYVATLVYAKSSWFGSAPNKTQVGSVLDYRQVRDELGCSGTVVTSHSVWLVANDEGRLPRDVEAYKNIPNLAGQISTVKPQDDEAEERAIQIGSLYPFLGGGYDRSKFTVISKLNEQGVFEPVAWVPELACLAASPQGDRVYLMTGLSRPKEGDRDDSARDAAAEQTVVFQSDDQGKTWSWRKEGLFPKANWIAWSLPLYFFDEKSIWTWVEHPDATNAAGSAQPLGLQYSGDGGKTVEDIRSAAPLTVSLQEAVRILGAKAAGKYEDGRPQNVTRHVVQLDADHAMAWISQVFDYVPQGREDSTRLRLTTQISLQRQGGQWTVGAVKQLNNLDFDKVIDNRAGQIVGIAYADDDSIPQTMLYRPDRQEWVAQGKLPSPFGVMVSSVRQDNGYAGQNTLVVNIDSEHVVPQWLYPSDNYPATISSGAVYYSKDWGASWRRLAIGDGYHGVLGFDAKHDRVFWISNRFWSSAVFTYTLD